MYKYVNNLVGIFEERLNMSTGLVNKMKNKEALKRIQGEKNTPKYAIAMSNIESLNIILEILKGLEFIDVSDTKEEFKGILSNYETFFDGDSFLYTENSFKDMDEVEINQIIMSEVFNNLSEYRKRINSTTIEIVTAYSVHLMNFWGIIESKQPIYVVSAREIMNGNERYFDGRYNTNFKYTKPTEEALELIWYKHKKKGINCSLYTSLNRCIVKTKRIS